MGKGDVGVMAEGPIKLHEVIAVEKTVKTAAHKAGGAAYHLLQKPELVNGHTRVFTPVDDEDENAKLPDENKKLQTTVMAELRKVAETDAEYLDVIATKDAGNTEAQADVAVDGVVILKGVPVTTLLSLEKFLTNLHTQISKLPILDPGDDWTYDSNKGCYVGKTAVGRSNRKVNKVITLALATDKHPAQTQLTVVDELAGHWHTTKLSGALPADGRSSMLRRVEELQKAVKQARERANSIEVEKKQIGARLYEWVFDGK